MQKAVRSFFTARNIAMLGVLLALVLVLQLFGLSVPMPGGTAMSFVLVPIIVGGMLLGPAAGGFLGLVFGIITIFDPLCLALMNYTPVLAVLTVLLKGTLAGILPALLFRVVVCCGFCRRGVRTDSKHGRVRARLPVHVRRRRCQRGQCVRRIHCADNDKFCDRTRGKPRARAGDLFGGQDSGKAPLRQVGALNYLAV